MMFGLSALAYTSIARRVRLGHREATVDTGKLRRLPMNLPSNAF